MPTAELLEVSRLEDLPEWEEQCRKYGSKVVTIVRFVSLISKDVSPEDEAELAAKDRRAEAAAIATGKLDLYKKGTRNEDGVADNQCWWTDAAEARNVVHSPEHIAATRFMIERAMYEDFYIEIYDVERAEDGKLNLLLSRTMTKADLEAHANPRYISDEITV
ncbi:MAG: hypothetical protein JWN75_389 [Candidatus Saccharibacteria bacterium]|nr:hypothetical protein [Candidatus Saccharibacteria bacterium]